jgi:hypothetical protein
LNFIKLKKKNNYVICIYLRIQLGSKTIFILDNVRVV